MLTINKTKEKEELCLALEGRLDTVTAPQLEKELQGSLADVKALLEYISSAGLRVLLAAQKIMNRQGEMKLVHVNETVKEIFEVTGFCDILNIE